MQSGSTRRNVNSVGNSHPDLSLPNRSGAGKKIVRKPLAPSPSNLLGEEEKANSTSPNTLGKGPGLRKRPAIIIPSIPQSPKINGGSTGGTNIARSKFDPMRAFRNSFLGKQPDNGEPLDNLFSKGKGKAPADDSLEQARDNKLSTKAREIREWMKGKSGSEIHHSALDAIKKAVGNDDTFGSTKMRQKVGGVRDLFKNRRPAPPPKDRGPKPGQTYEIVNRRIIENNPERTVEISTWKEQTAEKAKLNEEDRMSIYFLSADEYPQEGDYAANETFAKVEWRVDGSENPPEGQDCSQTGFGSSVDAEISHKKSQSRLQRSSSANRDPPSPLTPHERTISPSTSEKDPSSSAKENHIEVTVEHVDLATGGSSTPVKRATHRAPQARQRRRYHESPPIEKELPRFPYHPTRSGSTVSTVKSNSAIQFEGILRSCEPSLAHIAPMLRNLGIQKIEHLRAVARLSPLIRDREVKENALRQGITVIEWAILLDKLDKL